MLFRSYYGEMYCAKKDMLEALIEVNNNDIKNNLIGIESNMHLHLKRFKVKARNHADISLELEEKLKEAISIYKDFRILSSILSTKVRYFESMTFVLVSKYREAFEKLYFRGGF